MQACSDNSIDVNDVKKVQVLFIVENEGFRTAIRSGLEYCGCRVAAVATPDEALNLISTEQFDMVIYDLCVPGVNSLLSVLNAVRQTKPEVATLVLSDCPVPKDAMGVLSIKSDEILLKPTGWKIIAKRIQDRFPNRIEHRLVEIVSTATILEEEMSSTIQYWVSKVNGTRELASVSLSEEERSRHLPILLGTVMRRLRLPPNAKVPISTAARSYGVLRRKQGYTLSKIVEESRIFQASIINTLLSTLCKRDESKVLLDTMMIADEIHSQLKQAILGFMVFRVPSLVENRKLTSRKLSSSIHHAIREA